MRVPFKVIGASALALALALCGCGDKKSSSESDGGSSGSPTRAAFKPKVGKDVKYAIGVNLDKDQVFKIVDACIAELVKSLKDEMAKSPESDEESEMALKEKVAEIVGKLKADPKLLDSFQKDPEKTIESNLGVDIPDGAVQKVVEGVKAKLAGDKLSGVADTVKNLFNK